MIVDTRRSKIESPEYSEPRALTDGMTRWKWSREDYLRLADKGFFRNARVERIEGEIFCMSPQSEPHQSVLSELIFHFARSEIRVRFQLRCQGTLALGDSDPEPDIALVDRSHLRSEHSPETAVMIAEVSRSSLEFDRTVKLALYARAGIPEYWIVDVDGRRLEVYRQPTTGADGTATYAERIVLGPGDQIAPLFQADLVLAIEKLFPPTLNAEARGSEPKGC